MTWDENMLYFHGLGDIKIRANVAEKLGHLLQCNVLLRKFVFT